MLFAVRRHVQLECVRRGAAKSTRSATICSRAKGRHHSGNLRHWHVEQGLVDVVDPLPTDVESQPGTDARHIPTADSRRSSVSRRSTNDVIRNLTDSYPSSPLQDTNCVRLENKLVCGICNLGHCATKPTMNSRRRNSNNNDNYN